MGFNNKVKAERYPQEDIFRLINKIERKESRIYLIMSYYMANRSGELLPYLHYKTTYAKDSKTKKTLMKQGKRSVYPILKTKKPVSLTKGPIVSDIRYKYDDEGNPRMIIVPVPVFKTKGLPFEEAYIPRKNNPYFKEVYDYIEQRKQRDVERKHFLPKDKYYPLGLFGEFDIDEKGLIDIGEIQRYFWRFKKRVQTEIYKFAPGFKLHSLRTSRATNAAEQSKGDIFYVQGVTRNRDLKNLEQYVKPVQMEKKVEEYA